MGTDFILGDMLFIEILVLDSYKDLGLNNNLLLDFLKQVFSGDLLVSKYAITYNLTAIAANALLNLRVNKLIFVNILLVT